MQFSTVPPTPPTLTLDAFAARLASHANVDGILFMGSTGAGKITPSSDYDILLILADDPAAPRMVVTWVGGYLTEIYCTPLTALARIIADPTAWRRGSNEGAVLNWLRDGRIVHDRVGRLTEAQAVARATPSPLPRPEAAYWAWSDLGYNVAQLHRYLASDDPAYREVVDFRLPYCFVEAMTAYFTVRDLPWQGEKEAIRYWAAHDPDYLVQFRACLAETNRERKVAQFTALAQRTLAPVGALWAHGTTMIGAGRGWGAGPNAITRPLEDAIADTTAYWCALIASDPV